MVVIVAELLVVSKSVSLALALAVFARVPVVVGVTAIVTIAVDPLLIVPREQLTVVDPTQLPCVVEAEPNATPKGSVSVRFTFVAAAGPLLVTTIR